jgi:voltage-gated potassium channel Kch
VSSARSATRRQRLRYWFDNTMSRGTPALIGWLGLLSAVLVLLFGALLYLLAPGDLPGRDRSWSEALWTSLMHAMDPGTLSGDSGSTVFLLLGFVLTIGGLFIVSTLIGVLTTGLSDKLEDLRKGRSTVVETGHTAVIGWSDQIFTVVAELVEANASKRRSCVAILADRDKAEMDDELRARLGDTGRTRVVCRSGSPIEPTDLDLLSLDTARSIIVLSPPDEDADALVIKTLLALNNRTWRGRRPPIVASVADTGNLAAARLAGGPQTQIVDADDIAARLVVQSCRQSGLSVVYSDLLDFGGDEIYLHAEPRLTGRPYGEALFAYETATLIGLRRGDGSVLLNPPSDVEIQAGDQLVVIAEDDSVIRPGHDRPKVTADAIAPPNPRPAVPERTLLLGWNGRAPRIVRELDDFVAPGSVLQIAAAPDGGPAPELLAGPSRLTVNVKECDTTDRYALESLDVGTYDHVIVLADDRLEPQHADSRTLVTLLHLRDMEAHAGHRYSIVSEMNDDRNRRLAEVTEADDFVVSDKLISLLMCQLSENRHLGQVFGELFDAAGAEIYLKPATDYIRPDVPVTFATVIEAARLRGESAIGYRLHSGAAEPPSYGVRLNPRKDDIVTFTAQDRVIVLADE